MSITFSCACGQPVLVPDEMAGKQGRCPGCQAVLTVPARSRAAPDARTPTPDARRPTPDSRPPTPDPRPPTPDPTRVCPACGEAIKAVARKCRFCGEILDPSLLAARRVYGTEDQAPPASRAIAPAARGNNSLATASLVWSCVGLPACGLPAIVGVALGHRAMAQIRAGQADGLGLATAGLIIGYFAIAVWSLIALGAAAA